jgi:hypothetical protein
MKRRTFSLREMILVVVFIGSGRASTRAGTRFWTVSCLPTWKSGAIYPILRAHSTRTTPRARARSSRDRSAPADLRQAVRAFLLILVKRPASWHQGCIVTTQPANGARRSARCSAGQGVAPARITRRYPFLTPPAEAVGNTVGRPRHSNTRGRRVVSDIVSRIAFQSRIILWEAVRPSQVDDWRHLCDRPSGAALIAPGASAAVP